MRLEATKPPIQEDTAAEAKTSSLASRLPTELIYADTLASATLTFDYIMFIIVASVLAGIGLVTNSSVIVVASMLVSPLMGPITSCVIREILLPASFLLARPGLGALNLYRALRVSGACFASFR